MIESPMPWHATAWEQAVGLPVHALLVHGVSGSGERSFALALAHAWLCESAGPRPCGRCAGCHLCAAGNHPDLRVIEPEAMAAGLGAQDDAGEPESEDVDEGDGGRRAGKPSREIKIDQLRALADLAQITSHRGGARVVVIHPADTMNVAAANSLLKLLEEPPAGMRIILVCERLRRLGATLISRCVRVALAPPERTAAIAWLREQGVEDPPAALSRGGGAPLAALALDDPEQSALWRGWLSGVSAPADSAVQAARETDGVELPMLLSWMCRWVHDLGRIKAGAAPRYHPESAAALARIAGGLSLLRIARLARSFDRRQRWVKHPLNPQLQREALWLDYLQGVSPAGPAR